MSYLLRHNPENLKVDEEGFVDLDEFLLKLRERYDADKSFINEIVNRGDRRRFEIVGNKIRALYGHSFEVAVQLKEDKSIAVLYHGTTLESALKILSEGLKPMKRKWVHLSPTKEIAIVVGRRRASEPVILEVDVKEARKDGLRFFKATERIFLCRRVPPKYLKRIIEELS